MKNILGFLNPGFISKLLFDNKCSICAKPSQETFICRVCENGFIKRDKNNHIKKLKELTVYSFGVYDGSLRKGIIELKSHNKKLTNYFAERLADFWTVIIKDKNNKNFLIHPVPSHPSRIKERGYCQTSLIAARFAEILKLDFSNTLLKRVKPTQHMNSLADIEERKRNIQDAFQLITAPPKGKTIVLIDDIVTSGSTLCEIAKTIYRKHPFYKITGLTIASGDKLNL